MLAVSLPDNSMLRYAFSRISMNKIVTLLAIFLCSKIDTKNNFDK
ncbi:hypothetical protein yberc0001_33540 [Yersinia bercovieri ATCC 43970]|uniref:Lipoprotein n=1 Tax=Yersinia bercovieri ATCC 43970 TaxID=349968 RepID=A0ABM9XYH3_YERBE|nr:hypothetical protein yberc0001_33540 [Yersinia bercovieri ATCC 43970]